MSSEEPLPCPSCGQELHRHTFGGHYGAQVELDLCGHCELVWFDRLENVQLSAGGTLDLLRAMVEDLDRTRQPLPDHLRCPRCRLTMKQQSRRIGTTSYTVHQCRKGHGHAASWLEVLREKGCVRPLDAQQLAELRAHVRQISCSGCGAPVDLERHQACQHCSAPLSVLDHTALEATLASLREDEAARANPDGHLVAAQLVMDHLNTETTWKRHDRIAPSHELARVPGWGLLEFGLEALMAFLTQTAD